MLDTRPNTVIAREFAGAPWSGRIFTLGELYRAIRRDIRTIVVAVIASLVLALGYLAVTPSLYTSTARILIDPRLTAEFSSDQESARVPTLSADSLLVDSEVEAARSYALLRQVAEKMDVAHDLDFLDDGLLAASLRNVQAIITGWRREKPAAEPEPSETKYRAFAELIRIERVGQTYVIQMTYRSKRARHSAFIQLHPLAA